MAQASVSPLLANVYAHYVFDLWADQWRKRHARGDVVIVRFADDAVVGFEHRDDAERFWADLRDRLAKFNLELNAEKTRLIEFGRFAAERRAARGLGKPETFRFLGFTHICGKARNGRFKLKRITDSKRVPTKLNRLKDGIERRGGVPSAGEIRRAQLPRCVTTFYFTPQLPPVGRWSWCGRYGVLGRGGCVRSARRLWGSW